MTIVREIEGTPDFELGISRERKIIYYVDAPADAAKGLALFVPGCGADADNSYSRIVRRFITEVYGLVTVSVQYHALDARVSRDWYLGEPNITKGSVLRLEKTSQQFCEMRLKMAGVDTSGCANDYQLFRNYIEQFSAEPAELHGVVHPAFGEYQNFGVMQAVDVLRVLGDVLNSDLKFDRSNIVCVGSSHGGYLAHLVHKFAPNTITRVIDNSGYAEPILSYCGSGFDVNHRYGDVSLKMRTLSKWDFRSNFSPNFFNRDRFMIRNVADASHLDQMKEASTSFSSFHMLVSNQDKIVPSVEKIKQHNSLLRFGYESHLEVVSDISVDPVVFKTLDHALGVGVHKLFARYYEADREVRKNFTDFDRMSLVSYECEVGAYQFVYKNEYPFVEARYLA